MKKTPRFWRRSGCLSDMGLSYLHDDELSKTEKAKAIRHVKKCSWCQKTLKRFQRATDLYRALSR